jgi:hypothetical protein
MIRVFKITFFGIMQIFLFLSGFLIKKSERFQGGKFR